MYTIGLSDAVNPITCHQDDHALFEISFSAQYQYGLVFSNVHSSTKQPINANVKWDVWRRINKRINIKYRAARARNV